MGSMQTPRSQNRDWGTQTGIQQKPGSQRRGKLSAEEQDLERRVLARLALASR